MKASGIEESVTARHQITCFISSKIHFTSMKVQVISEVYEGEWNRGERHGQVNPKLTWFTSTKVQILTTEKLLQGR
jgi:hypothetical protein